MGVHPGAFGITPHRNSTACWAGYWCVYEITDAGIFLKDLFVFNRKGHYPDINGISVSREPDGTLQDYMGHAVYQNLNIKLPYTGKILVGRDFLDEYYIHMGHQRAFAYKTLVELVFEGGTLVQTNDQSQVAEALRQCIKEGRPRKEASAERLWWL